MGFWDDGIGSTGVTMPKPRPERRISRSAGVLTAFVVLAAGAACGGDDTTLRSVQPFMVLDPDPGTTLKFADIDLTRTQDDPQIIAVQNIGEGILSLDRVVINGDDTSAFRVSSRPKA